MTPATISSHRATPLAACATHKRLHLEIALSDAFICPTGTGHAKYFQQPLLHRSKYRYPGVAQLGARLTGGQEAVSSSLATRTRNAKKPVSAMPTDFFSII